MKKVFVAAGVLALTLLARPAWATILSEDPSVMGGYESAMEESRRPSPIYGLLAQATPASQPTQLPPVTVTGEPEGKLAEEAPVGKYGQPEWTTHRRFPGTRIYVLPEGQIEAEFWTVARIRRHGPSQVQNQVEVEFGLPARFQLDLYLIGRNEGSDTTFVDEQIELRYALADWEKIWGNPTFYLEYVHQSGKDEPDKVETKLLLGGEAAPRWHWGANLVFEHGMGGEQENEYALTLALSYSVFDKRLSVGAESEFSFSNVKDDRNHWEEDILIGPSVQWRPHDKFHLSLAPLFGVTENSKAVKLLFNMGWEF